MKHLRFALALCLHSVSSDAEVLRVDVTSRKDIQQYGYDGITAKAYSSIDPRDPRNAGIADVAQAPKHADRRDANASLRVRDALASAAQTIPRSEWTMAGAPIGVVVTMKKGFEPGRNYELSYKAANPPISGLGLAAVRDVASFAKYGAQR